MIVPNIIVPRTTPVGLVLVGLALVVALVLPVAMAQEPAAETSGEAEPAGEAEASGESEPASPEPVERQVPAGGKVLVGRIDGEINLAASAYVKRLIEAATVSEAAVLMLELNTFGGRVDAAVLIRDALIDAPMHTAVFINKRAISAGALISLACNSIAISPGGTIGAATPIASSPGQEMPAAVEEKYLSYFRQEMRSTAETRGRNGDIAEAMVDADAEVPGVSDKGKLLTLNTRSALEHKFADAEARSLEEALEALGLDGPIEEIARTWSEDLVGFLTSSAIASILVLGMMVLGYMEMQSPGFGVFGIGALVCFLLLYFSHYLVDLAGYEELLLFGLGVALLVVELFAIPGFGLIGVAGLLAVLSSLVMVLMAGDWSDISFENPFTAEAITRVLVTTVLGIVAILVLMRYLPTIGDRTGLGRRLVLASELESAAGFESHEPAADELVGRTGTTLTALRPSGKARIDGRRLNVETEGDFLDRGQEVRVLRSEPGRVVVRRV